MNLFGQVEPTALDLHAALDLACESLQKYTSLPPLLSSSITAPMVRISSALNTYTLLILKAIP